MLLVVIVSGGGELVDHHRGGDIGIMVDEDMAKG